MSLLRCDGCDAIVDSDEDPEGFYVKDGMFYCEWCRDGMEEEADDGEDQGEMDGPSE